MNCQEIKPASSHAKMKLLQFVILNFLKQRLCHSKSTFLRGPVRGCRSFPSYSDLRQLGVQSFVSCPLNHCRPLLALLSKKVKYLFHFRSLIETHAFTMATKNTTQSQRGYFVVYGPIYVFAFYNYSATAHMLHDMQIEQLMIISPCLLAPRAREARHYMQGCLHYLTTSKHPRQQKDSSFSGKTFSGKFRAVSLEKKHLEVLFKCDKTSMVFTKF